MVKPYEKGWAHMKRSSDEQRHDERSVRKKTEKLNQCTKEIEKELQALDQAHKRAKKQTREDADQRKVEFLRQAATLRRRVDDTTTALEAQRQAIEQNQPELVEARQRLNDLLAQHRERRETLENTKESRLRAVHEEIEVLERAAG
jgi:DNA repair exonuclease SbcCD ATPase subunit